MAAVRWDDWSLVSQAIRVPSLGANDGAEIGAPRLVAICFADRWSKPAMSTAIAIEAIRMGRDVEVRLPTCEHTSRCVQC
jgi:hypothetical protein